MQLVQQGLRDQLEQQELIQLLQALQVQQVTLVQPVLQAKLDQLDRQVQLD